MVHDDEALLANPYWAALITAQADIAIGTAFARRFPASEIPFAGIADQSHRALDDLCALLDPGESVYVTNAVPLTYRGLRETRVMPGLQMLLPKAASIPPPASIAIQALGESAAPEMIALKAVAFPGYFGPRAAGLGRFYGVRSHNGSLVAMCGERLMLPGYREISALCTRPDHAGKGYAAALVAHLLRKHRAESIRSFLHVTADNSRAIALYQRLGFVTTRSITWRSLKRVQA